MFKQISAVPALPEIEAKVAKYWAEIDIVQQLKKMRQDAKATEKVYYDGPITANGIPHYGHAITWTLKDIVPRHWTMQGHLVKRNMGWDCKGILVEYEVEKELGFKRKEDIAEYGVAKFVQYCRDYVNRFVDEIFRYEKLLGRWFDPAEIYDTRDAAYVESEWLALSELYKKGLFYEGYKVVPYSTRAGTVLSQHEVSDGGYKELEDPFVTVKFELKDEPSTYLLAWTTTPWTIPGNLLLAVGKTYQYVKVECEGSKYILAKDRVESVFEGKTYKVVSQVKPEDLEGKEYAQPFDFYEQKRSEGAFKVVFAHHVSVDDGTGIVHIAPYGLEDYDVLMAQNISLFDYLDDTVHFTDAVKPYQGQFYKQADDNIIADLESKGVLFNHGKLVHRMPMCYRTGTPLIYKPVKSWYVAVTKIKEKMLSENSGVNWKPEHLKDGNSGVWLQNVRDWALSRSRYWGTPMPVWVNDKTGEKVVIGSFEELKKLSGVEIKDPHKPYVDEITWEDKVNGGTFKRIPDVLDVWFDSGCMPFAHIHYPFENVERLKQVMPAEYISEGPDQVRLWFYVMHVLGVALFDQIPYKNVVTIGMLLDATGKKMSKSKRNYAPMDEVLSEYGGDILRYFILNSSIVHGQDTIFSDKELKEARKEFFLPLWNSVKYFLTYADLYNFEPTLAEPKSDNLLDQWIITRLKETSEVFIKNMDAYEIMDACRALAPFVTDLSTWYIRRSRDRIKDGDKQSLSTLYYVLTTFTKLMSPVAPFLSEELYEMLRLRELTKLPSVHADTYTNLQPLTAAETELLKQMSTTRRAVSLALSVRVDKGIKVRQPLQTLYVLVTGQDESQNLVSDLVLDEVNVKEVKLISASEFEKLVPAESLVMAEDYFAKILLDTTVTEDLKLEGQAREIVRQLQDLRKQSNLAVNQEVSFAYPNETEIKKAIEKFGDDIKKKVVAKELVVGETFAIRE